MKTDERKCVLDACISKQYMKILICIAGDLILFINWGYYCEKSNHESLEYF